MKKNSSPFRRISRVLFSFVISAACGVLVAACSDKEAGQSSEYTGNNTPIEKRIRASLGEGPLTGEARAQIALLADTVEANDGEAYQTLRRIGRDAVPPLVEVLYGSYHENIKQNALWILGGFGLAATRATPFLEEIKIKGPTWITFAATQAIQKIEEAKTCGLPGLPDNVEVHVVGRYKGKKELDVQLGQSGHTVTEIEVVVEKTDNPVALVLTAYDPVVWKVGQTPASKLAAVLVSGYHTQALLGIPKNVPHKVISGEQSLGCDAFNASGAEEAAEIERDILALTGHGIDKFHGVSPTAYFRVGGDPHFEPTIVSFSPDLSLHDYDVYEGDIPAGPRGIEELRRRGKIRPATQQECNEWMDGARKHNPEMHTQLYSTSTYLVLEKITLPPGLFGGHSKVFIIPADVPKPDGPKGHCQFCFMKNFTRE